jgi:FMN phosphatase YigB (HAD superfamily)
MGMKSRCFDVLMIDLNGTFMFGQDRFGRNENYHRTYIDLGGGTLNASQIHNLVSEVFIFMNQLYKDPENYDAFPQITQVLIDLFMKTELPVNERILLEQVIARHEIGVIADKEVAALKALAKTYRLILVSNIWSRKELWIDYFREKQIADIFSGIVFSSDHNCIKPGLRIYQIAQKFSDCATNRILFVGDDPQCDVATPRTLGMSTARVRGTHKEFMHEADLVIDGIGDLVSILA